MTAGQLAFDALERDPLPTRSSDRLPLGPLCSWPGCGEDRRQRGARGDALCSVHLTRLHRGKPMDGPRRRRRVGAPKATCWLPFCSEAVHANGFCVGHGSQRRFGRPLAPLTPRPRGSLEDRFWRYANPMVEACWLWTGPRDGHDYGVLSIGGRGTGRVAAHRLSYELLVGPIPDGLHIDHLCRTPLCVNPAHLEPVSQAENNRRALPYRTRRPKPTHCRHGHSYSDPGNLYVRPSGTYGCRECQRLRGMASA